MGDHPRSTRRPRRSALASGLLAAGLAATALAGCSSSPAEDGAGDTAAIGTARQPAASRTANEAYLLEIGYQAEQATCVSRAVTVDLRVLLSGTDGGDKPTDRPGFDQFAAATKRCIEADDALTTTTAPTG